MSWITKELSEVCEIKLGKTPSRSDKSFWDVEKISNNKWASIADLSKVKGRNIFETKEYISDKGAKLFNPVEANTILMSFKLSIGKLAITTEKIYTNEAIVALPIKIKDKISQEFLYYYLQFYDWDKESENDIKVKGKTLNKEKLKKIKVPIPSLATQQKIVAKLDAIFAEIDIATSAAQANANNAEALFQSYLTEVFERGGEGWETKKLCEVSSFDKNQGLHNGIPYIGMENIQSHTTQLISGVELVEEAKSSTFKFNETHLLYGRLRPYLNKVYAPDFVGHCSTEIFPIKPFSNLLRAYLKYWFINAKTVNRINATCTGARMPRANMNAVMDFDFPLPPISIQKQLIEYFDSVQNSTHIAIVSYKAKIAEITALKQSILQRAFSGELVKD